jgi:hypothetical protein
MSIAMVNLNDLQRQVIEMLDSNAGVVSTFERVRDAFNTAFDEHMIEVTDMAFGAVVGVVIEACDDTEVVFLPTLDADSNELGQTVVESVIGMISNASSGFDELTNTLVEEMSENAQKVRASKAVTYLIPRNQD